MQTLSGIELSQLHQKLDALRFGDVEEETSTSGTKDLGRLIYAFSMNSINFVQAREALEKILGYAKKRNSENVTSNVKIAFVSSKCLPCDEKLSSTLQELAAENANLVFLYVPNISIHTDTPEASIELANFSLMVRDCITCTLIRVENSEETCRKLPETVLTSIYQVPSAFKGCFGHLLLSTGLTKRKCCA